MKLLLNLLYVCAFFYIEILFVGFIFFFLQHNECVFHKWHAQRSGRINYDFTRVSSERLIIQMCLELQNVLAVY